MGKNLDLVRIRPRPDGASDQPVRSHEPDRSADYRSPNNDSPKRPRKPIRSLLIAITLIALSGLAGYYLFNRYLGPQDIIIISEKPDASSVETISSSTILDHDALNIFDRGAGENESKRIIQTLTNSGFTPRYFRSNNYSFKQSFIYFHSSRADRARQLIKLLENENLIEKESPLPGISIYLGTD